tara:strand:- start:14898 stop:15752 length:855 start_codon:yes stop_codon:yes gene_type:complete
MKPQQALASWALRWAGLLGVSAAATGANPYGWSLFGYIWALSHKTAMNAHIHELMPPDPSRPLMQLAIGLAIVLGLLCIWAWRRGLHLPGTALLHVALFAVMTSQALRIIVWAGLAYVVAAAPLIQALWNSYRRPVGHPLARRAQMAVVAALVLAIAAPASAWLQAPVRVADCGASRDAIQRLDHLLAPDAHWFSSERVGSCTALVAPARRVFIDTRFDFYPEAFVLDWFKAYQYTDGWRALFDRWHIDYVLLANGAPLVSPLSHAPDFTQQRLGNRMLLFSRR